MNINKVCSCRVSSPTSYAFMIQILVYELTMDQEKLNEAVMVLNKNLQVRDATVEIPQKSLTDHDPSLGNQYPEYERRACCSNVQELQIECSISFGRYGLLGITRICIY